jgi:addiction module HigA family antidote
MPRAPIHPGEILADELEELGVTATDLARQIRVPANRISQIVNGKRAITGDTALRLGHWFGTSPQFWMNLQALYDVRLAEQEAGSQIRRLPTKPARPETDCFRECAGRADGKRAREALKKIRDVPPVEDDEIELPVEAREPEAVYRTRAKAASKAQAKARKRPRS